MRRNRMLAIIGVSAFSLVAPGLTRVGVDAAPRSPLLALLDVVPDSDRGRMIVLEDLDAARQAFGLAKPKTDKAALDQLVNLSNRTGLRFPAFANSAADVKAWRAELGFSILEATRQAGIGDPPGQIRIVDVTSTADIERAVKSDPVWKSALKTPTYKGTRYYRWSTEPTLEITKRTAVRQLGIGGQMAVLGKRVILTGYDTQIRESIDATQANAATLSQWDTLGLLFESLTPINPYAVTLGSARRGGSDPASILGGDPSAPQPRPLRPFEEVAIGLGAKAAKPTIVIAYAHVNTASAKTNEERFKAIWSGTDQRGRPWSDVATLRSTSVVGRVLTVELEPRDNPAFAFRAYLLGEALFTTG